MNQDEEATLTYAAAGEVLLSLNKRFSPAEAATVLLCAMGRLAAITQVPEPKAWRVITAADCHAGFRFGYANQAAQLRGGKP